LIEKRIALPLQAHKRLSEAVLDQVLTAFPNLLGRHVGLYWPFKREISLLALAETIIAAGGSVALPVVTGKAQPLQFRDWCPGDALESGPFDIPYPRDGPAVSPEVLLVALVGFDSKNYRLGYGGGYYDRTLAASVPRPTTIGIGFELMRLKTIQPLPHDIAMDAIITESNLYRRQPQTGRHDLQG
jgi:5-formyltetrahydrofolate cyclo-ligase